MEIVLKPVLQAHTTLLLAKLAFPAALAIAYLALRQCATDVLPDTLYSMEHAFKDAQVVHSDQITIMGWNAVHALHNVQLVLLSINVQGVLQV